MYALAGWLLAQAVLERDLPVPSEREVLERMPAGALAPAEVDPDRMSPRELRSLPAIGPARALAIARARWERGLTRGPDSWEDLPGIGPETVRAIRAALEGCTGGENPGEPRQELRGEPRQEPRLEKGKPR